MPTTAHLTNEKYAGHDVVVASGYKYYVVSKHKTQFNARRKFGRLDFPKTAKIRKVGKWWMVLQGLPRQYQNGRLL